MLTRRIVLASPLALTACNGSLPPPQTVAVVARDVQIIAKGLDRTLVQLSALDLPGLTPAVLDVCQLSLASIQTAAGALSGVATVEEAQPIVQRVAGYVNAFVDALAVLPLPPQIKTALVAAQILLPVVEMAVNLVVPPKAAVSAMTADQARAALK